jgi:hypothetical protein
VSAPPAGAERAAPPSDAAALRAEHDALAVELATRRSIDLLRRVAYSGFAAFITAGLSAKLAFDRWFSLRPSRFKGPPVWFFCAVGVTVVLFALAAVWLTRSLRLQRVENARFARMRELRERLELDP